MRAVMVLAVIAVLAGCDGPETPRPPEAALVGTTPPEWKVDRWLNSPPRHCGQKRVSHRTDRVRPELHGFVVRSEGLEPPRFYSLPPQGSASTNSATSAWDTGWKEFGLPDQRRRCNKSEMEGQGGFATELTT